MEHLTPQDQEIQSQFKLALIIQITRENKVLKLHYSVFQTDADKKFNTY